MSLKYFLFLRHSSRNETTAISGRYMACWEETLSVIETEVLQILSCHNYGWVQTCSSGESIPWHHMYMVLAPLGGAHLNKEASRGLEARSGTWVVLALDLECDQTTHVPFFSVLPLFLTLSLSLDTVDTLIKTARNLYRRDTHTLSHSFFAFHLLFYITTALACAACIPPRLPALRPWMGQPGPGRARASRGRTSWTARRARFPRSPSPTPIRWAFWKNKIK